MAISTYANLKTAVANWLNTTALTSVIPDFIALAEADFNATLYLNRLLTRNPAFSASAQFTALPTDFRRMRGVTLLYGGRRYPLGYESPDSFSAMNSGITTDIPGKYTIIGSEIGLHEAPSGATLELVYWPSVTALSDSVTTSDLLTLWPLLYLYRACIEGAIYTRDDSLQARAEAHYARALGAAVASDAVNAYGTAPTMRAA